MFNAPTKRMIGVYLKYENILKLTCKPSASSTSDRMLVNETSIYSI